MPVNNDNIVAGSPAASESDIRARLAAMYGENREITGEYDTELSAKCKNGTFVGKLNGDIIEYRGVPFAKPPVGELRWKRPEPVEDSDGVFEAYYNGKTPIQTEWITEQASYYVQGEDCLYLNIWVNKSCTESKKPVMVFLHGGSYGWGGTADPLYDGTAFVSAQPDIVMVTVGYRTGLMGFVDLSYLEGGEDFPDAPNLGLLDQIEALRWVKKNISAFSGDPDNVTVFGESAGGGTVSLLPIMPVAKGLFKKVIAQSGSVALTFSKEQCKGFTQNLIKVSGKKRMSDLMALSEEELRKINEEVNGDNNFPQRDGRLIPLDCYGAYKKGLSVDIDMLSGTNADESNYWVDEVGGIVPYRMSIPIKFENDMKGLRIVDRQRVKRFMSRLKGHSIWRMSEFYDEMMFRLPAVKQAEDHTVRGGRAYMYYWTEPSTLRYRGACHAVELAYVFGNLDETIYTGVRADEKLSNTVMQMWSNFARTGDPSTKDIEWPEYNTRTRYTMVFSKNPEVKSDVLRAQRKELMPLLHYNINPSYANMDYNVPFVHKAVGMVLGTAAAVVAGAALIKKLLK